MQEFSLTILSNSTAELYGNTLSAFTNLLNSTITLEDNWEVGLSNVFMNDVDYTERGKRDIEHEKYSADLSEIRTLIDDYFKLIPEENKEEGKPKKKRSDNLSVTEYFDSIIHPMQRLTQKLLEQTLDEIHKINNNTNIIDHAFIYTDIIQAHNIGSQSSRCLKVIPITNKRSYFTFNKIDYFPLQSNILKDISILITNGVGEKMNFTSSSLPTFCTLHFRKNI